jgi:primosomal protein N' (replication factor Y)
MRVRVPFGREILIGYIVRVGGIPDTAGKQIKNVIARLEETPSVNPELLALTQWVSERYLTALGQCLRLAFPGAPENEKRSQPRAPSDAKAPESVYVEASVLPDLLQPIKDHILRAVTEQTPGAFLAPAEPHELAGLYRAALRATRRMKRSMLVLVPETSRVGALQRLLQDESGGSCEAYHGGLSLAERRRAWSAIQQGHVSAVVGTRSAVFAPLQNLGLILIEQEDHSSYKAENSPKYDARVVAAERMRHLGGVLVLASAHPSLESVYATGNVGRLRWREPSGSPAIRIVNLRDAPGEVLSPTMIEAIARRLSAHQKILLFINRKGFASVLLCRDCGQAVRCPQCSVGMTYHKQEGILLCAHCGRREGAPTLCPACRSTRLFPSGWGTEGVEELVKARFPQARIGRLERGRQKQADALLLSQFETGNLDVLIGTQLLVTRHVQPIASLVGFVAPDAALHQPDFRAAERAYHLFRDVISLADTRSADSEVLLQTHIPEHHVIHSLAAQNPSVFYDTEFAARQMLGYPPFGHLIGLRVSGTLEDRVVAAAERWATLMHQEKGRFDLLGPIPAIPPRLRGRFRRQLILKGADDGVLRDAVRRTRAKLESEGQAGKLRYDVDVDPQSLIG